MQTRRDFLRTATTTLVLVPFAPLLGCSGGALQGPGSDGGGSCDGLFEASTSTPDPLAGGQGHIHTVCVPTSDLTSPPSGAMTYVTSISLDHTHTVTLSQAQLSQIEAGQTVTVTTSNNGMHTHMFSIAKNLTAT